MIVVVEVVVAAFAVLYALYAIFAWNYYGNRFGGPHTSTDIEKKRRRKIVIKLAIKLLLITHTPHVTG